MTTADKEIIAIFASVIVVTITIVSLMVCVSDTKPLDVCQSVCYPNDQIGYNAKMQKCVCNMRIEYRDLK